MPSATICSNQSQSKLSVSCPHSSESLDRLERAILQSVNFERLMIETIDAVLLLKTEQFLDALKLRQSGLYRIEYRLFFLNSLLEEFFLLLA